MRRASLCPLVALALAAAPARAEIVGAPDFEAMSAGRTLAYERSGQPYGAEQYLPGRRVIWQFADGSCSRGFWYAQERSICFLYDTGDPGLCWLFERRGGDFYARPSDAPAGDASELRMSGEIDGPLACALPGPGV